MDLIKNLLKYFIILIVIALLAVCMIGAVLFLFPTVEFGGFKYVTNQKKDSIVVTGASVTKINVETDNYDIIIKPNEYNIGSGNANNLTMIISNNYTGFSNTASTLQVKNIANAEFVDSTNFDVNLIKNDTEYSIVLKEPTGAVMYGDSCVIIYLPDNANNVEYNLTTNKGKISFSKNVKKESKKISTSNITLSVNTSIGSFDLDNAVMQDGSNLNIKNYIGRVVVNSEKIGNVKIESNSGNFTFRSVGYDGFSGGNLVVSGNNPYITVGTIYGSLTFNSTTGYLKVEKLIGGGHLETENGIIKINKIENSISIKNNSGDTIINQIDDAGKSEKSVVIESKSGNVVLGEEIKVNETTYSGIYSLTSVTTTSGKVTISNLYEQNAEIETGKGSVNVSFAISEDEKNLNVKTVSGAITIENIYGDITAETENSSKIIAKFYRISSLSSFITDGGVVDITLPAPTNDPNRQYNLSLLSKCNKLSIDIGSFSKPSFDDNKNLEGNYSFEKEFPDDKEKFPDDKEKFPDETTTTNTISVKTNSGKIIVHEN